MKRLFFLLLITQAALVTYAQHPPFWDEIQAFKKADSLNPPPAHPIVFTGSSSFRKWTGVKEAFPGYPIINRGFGGSTFPDVIRYVDDVVIKYNPRQVVIYCGDNDLASSDTVTAQMVFKRFTTLYTIIRSKLPQTDILYVSIKPSPSRQRLMPRMEEANKLIAGFIHTQKNAAFADVYHAMLTPEGKIIDGIWENDKLHMTNEGYKIWQKIIAPYLVKP